MIEKRKQNDRHDTQSECNGAFVIIEFYCTTEFRIIIGFIIDKENLVLAVLSNGKLFSKLSIITFQKLESECVLRAELHFRNSCPHVRLNYERTTSEEQK